MWTFQEKKISEEDKKSEKEPESEKEVSQKSEELKVESPKKIEVSTIFTQTDPKSPTPPPEEKIVTPPPEMEARETQVMLSKKFVDIKKFAKYLHNGYRIFYKSLYFH